MHDERAVELASGLLLQQYTHLCHILFTVIELLLVILIVLMQHACGARG